MNQGLQPKFLRPALLYIFCAVTVSALQVIKYLVHQSSVNPETLFLLRKVIFVIQLSLLTFALVLYVITGKKIKSIASTLLQVLVILLVLNNLAWIGYRIGASYYPETDNPLTRYPEVDFEKIYTGMNRDEITTLLKETWGRPLELNAGVLQFREKEFSGNYVNIDKNGLRFNPAKPVIPPDTSLFNIFIYGGSTTFGYGVADNQTIPFYLQELLKARKKDVAVYNAGQAYYYSQQERILFETTVISGIKPDMAIFIDGLNDFHGLADRPKATSFVKPERSKLSGLAENIPLVKFCIHTHRYFTASGSNRAADTETEVPGAEELISAYLKNKQLIGHISHNENIETLFIIQPVPFYRSAKHNNPFIHSETPSSISRVYQLLESMFKNNELDPDMVWLGDMQDTLNKTLYVDKVHYSPEMNKLIASALCDKIYMTR